MRFIKCGVVGLKMVLYAGNIADFLQTTSSGGMHIVVEQQGIAPFPDASGFDTSVGLFSSYGYKQVIIASFSKLNLNVAFQYKYDRLPAPYTDCLMPESRIPYYLYLDKYYSVEGCYRTCIQTAVMKRCGCSDPRFPQSPEWPNNVPVCTVDSTCLQLFLNESNDLDCKCPVECR